MRTYLTLKSTTERWENFILVKLWHKIIKHKGDLAGFDYPNDHRQKMGRATAYKSWQKVSKRDCCET